MKLYAGSGPLLEDFLRAMQLARKTTQQYSGNFKAEAVAEGWGRKPMLSQWFSVLESIITA